MGTRTALCDLGWTVAKIEVDAGEAPEAGDPSQDSITFLQPADDTTAAVSLSIIGREAILLLRDFIIETLDEGDLA